MSEWVVLLWSSTQDHLCEEVYFCAAQQWQAEVGAREKLNAHRICIPDGRRYDRWSLYPVLGGARGTALVATGTPARTTRTTRFGHDVR